jgi:hypothetical protein
MKTSLIIIIVIFSLSMQINSKKLKGNNINDDIGNFFSGIFSKGGNSIFGNYDFNAFTKSKINFPNASQRILGTNQIGIPQIPPGDISIGGSTIFPPTGGIGKTIGAPSPKQIVIPPPLPVSPPSLTVGSPTQETYVPGFIGKGIGSGLIPHGKGKFIGNPLPVYRPDVETVDTVRVIQDPIKIERPQDIVGGPDTPQTGILTNEGNQNHDDGQDNKEEAEMSIPDDLTVIN